MLDSGLEIRWVGVRLLPLTLVFSAFLSHLVGDYFGSAPGWELWPLLPFSNISVSCGCAWNLVSWQNTLITLAAIAIALWAGAHRDHAPLKFIHSGLERAGVNTLQLRWALVLCHWCSARGAVRFQGCHRALCPAHIASRNRFRLLCPECESH